MPKTYLILEFTALFVALPILLRYVPWRIPPLPILWLAAGLCLFALLRDPAFNRALLWNPAPLVIAWRSIFLIFAISAAIVSAAVYFFVPHLLFVFVRANPIFWAVVMLLYPVLSVYPQSIIYRAFLMHRYQPLFHSSAILILVSAAGFSLMHIVFRNYVAVPLTFAGGLLFAWRYQQTDSLFVSSLEHALYGCFLFTIGLGLYFYARAI